MHLSQSSTDSDLKAPVSLRFRSKKTDINQSNITIPSLIPIGTESVDAKIQAIKTSVTHIYEFRNNLANSYREFTQGGNINDGNENLSEAMIRFREQINDCDWKLTRPYRYKMEITTNQVPNLQNVNNFNRINEMCYQIIKSANVLQEDLRNLNEDIEIEKQQIIATVNFDPSNLDTNACRTKTSLDSQMENQVSRLHIYQTNQMSIQTMLRDLENAQNQAKKLFNNLVNTCGNYLVDRIV